MECHKHKGNDVTLVCSKCDNELICNKCLVESHNGHHMKSLEEAEKTMRERLQQQSSENTQLVSDLDEQLTHIEEVKKKQEAAADGVDKTINDRREALHRLVDRTADHLLGECHEILQENIATLNEQSETINEQKTKARQIISKIGKILNETKGVNTIMASSKIRNETVENIPNISLAVREIQYIQDPIDEHKIKSNFGIVTKMYLDASKGSDFVEHLNPSVDNNDSLTTQRGSDVEAAIEKKLYSVSQEFQHSTTHEVRVITVYDNNTCLVKCKGETEIKLINDKGHIHQRINLTSEVIHDVASSADGSILACSEQPNCILKFTLPKAEVTTFCSTENLAPRAIRCTSTGELIVTFSESASMLHLFTKKKYILIKYDASGNELAKVERDEFNDVLLHGPFRMEINHAEDTVIVVNQESSKLRYLILLDIQLNVKFRYLSNRFIVQRSQKLQLSKENLHFFIYDVAFDSKDNIIICEKFSKSVQFLGPACDVLQVLFTDDVFSWSLAVTVDDKIWIGRNDGRIKVLGFDCP